MSELGIDVVLLSVGPDLPYLIGYEAMPLERLTMLVLPREDEPTLFIPRLEVPRVDLEPEVFEVQAWDETDDPVELVAAKVRPGATVAIGDRTWARFVLEIQDVLPGRTFLKASAVLGPLRAVKDAAEIEALRKAGAAADRVATQLQSGDIPLLGRTEAEVSTDIGHRLLAEGHDRVNFAIVASGPNAASPHHEPGTRTIGRGEIVLCDFGGTMLADGGAGYCSDITRCVFTGEPPQEVQSMYDVLADAQEAAVAAATVGTPCESVDAAARDRITDAGYGEWFIHRTGHGIGIEAHEDPYMVSGNTTPLEPGHAFSVEPGIYLPGRWGARLEDIVVTMKAGPERLNNVDHHLVPVDA